MKKVVAQVHSKIEEDCYLVATSTGQTIVIICPMKLIPDQSYVFLNPSAMDKDEVIQKVDPRYKGVLSKVKVENTVSKKDKDILEKKLRAYLKLKGIEIKARSRKVYCRTQTGWTHAGKVPKKT